ncbi:hypothetical protein AB0M20_25225, partial [Actinoplanes sp. NPDC051633]
MRGRAGKVTPTDAASSSRSRRSAWLLVCVITLGLSGTMLATAALRHADRERVHRALSQQTSLVSTLVAAELRRYTGFLADLAAALGAQGELEASEFAATTANVNRQRLPGASGVSMVVPAPLGRIPQVQSY